MSNSPCGGSTKPRPQINLILRWSIKNSKWLNCEISGLHYINNFITSDWGIIKDYWPLCWWGKLVALAYWNRFWPQTSSIGLTQRNSGKNSKSSDLGSWKKKKIICRSVWKNYIMVVVWLGLDCQTTQLVLGHKTTWLGWDSKTTYLGWDYKTIG